MLIRGDIIVGVDVHLATTITNVGIAVWITHQVVWLRSY